MAKVNPVSLCPGCRAELPHPIPSHCPACDRKLDKPENPYFAAPDYLYYQLEDHRERLGVNQSKPMTSPQKKELAEVETEFAKWLRTTTPQDKIAAFNDVIAYLKNLVVSETPVDQIRILTAKGRQIGELASAIEKYAQAGGQFYGTKAERLQAKSRSTDGSEEAAD